MLLAYLDESRSDEGFYVGALVVPGSEVMPLAHDLQKVIEYAQDTYGRINEDAELHGYPLVNGIEDWERLKPNIPARIDIYNHAIDAIAAHDVTVCIRGIEIKGYRRRHPHGDIHEFALSFALERVQSRALAADDVALVIADEVRGSETGFRRTLRDAAKFGTYGWRSTRLDRIADALHFAPSSSSRLLQAVDLVTYALHAKSAALQGREGAVVS